MNVFRTIYHALRMREMCWNDGTDASTWESTLNEMLLKYPFDEFKVLYFDKQEIIFKGSTYYSDYIGIKFVVKVVSCISHTDIECVILNRDSYDANFPEDEVCEFIEGEVYETNVEKVHEKFKKDYVILIETDTNIECHRNNLSARTSLEKAGFVFSSSGWVNGKIVAFYVNPKQNITAKISVFQLTDLTTIEEE